MASTSLVPFLIVLVFLQLNQISSAQCEEPPRGEVRYPDIRHLVLYKYGAYADNSKGGCHKEFFPSDDEVTVIINNITKALWDAGYKIMSLILEKRLISVTPYNWYQRDRITIYNNNTITIFAPPDEEAAGIENYEFLGYQIAKSKIDKEAFDSGRLFEGSEILTLDINSDVKVSTLKVTEPKSGCPSINGVKITKWNIYNDGSVVVHGVEDFFHPKFRFPSGFDDQWEKESLKDTFSKVLNGSP